MKGSHSFSVSTASRELLDSTSLSPAAISARFRGFLRSRPLRRLRRVVAQGPTEPRRSDSKPKGSAANSPVSLVDRVTFVDGPVQDASQDSVFTAVQRTLPIYGD